MFKDKEHGADDVYSFREEREGEGGRRRKVGCRKIHFYKPSFA